MKIRIATLAFSTALLFATSVARAEETVAPEPAEKTGSVVERGVDKAADAVETTARRTGEGISIGVKKGTEAVKRVVTGTGEVLERGASKARAAVSPASSVPLPAWTPK
jgi:hypothetical protein